MQVLRRLYENPTPELQSEFEKLNAQLLELSPRVHPDQWEMLKRSLAALKRARLQMDELDRLISEN